MQHILGPLCKETQSLLISPQIANICDRGYVGPATTLSTFASLLRTKEQNPRATLLLLFLNVAHEKEHELGMTYKKADLASRMKRLVKLIGVDMEATARLAMGDRTLLFDPEFHRRMRLHDMFADFDELFDGFLKGARMNELAKQNGVRVKKQQSVVDKWPYRVTQRTSEKEFEIMSNLVVTEWERYVELEQAE